MMLDMPEERGEEERRGARTPCTVTAPARIAGHRLPVWANKIGRVFALLCELKEDRESVKVGGGLGLYGEYGGPSCVGQGQTVEGCWMVCGSKRSWCVDGGRTRSLEQGLWRAVCGVRCCAIEAKSLRREEDRTKRTRATATHGSTDGRTTRVALFQ
jgi:hypothetical protein